MFRVWFGCKDVKLSPKVKVSMVGHGPTEIVSVFRAQKFSGDASNLAHAEHLQFPLYGNAGSLLRI